VLLGKPGLIGPRCDIHGSVHAHVLVLETHAPRFAQTAPLAIDKRISTASSRPVERPGRVAPGV